MRRVALVVALFLCAAAPAAAEDCPKVTGAETQKCATLDDLTTAGTATNGHTDPSDWAGLTPVEQRNPTGVKGQQIDGYFPDTSTTNSTNGWFHDAQFVMRFPDKWNGKLLITGAPGIRKQYSVDPVFGDWAVGNGFAYASTDKGNTGVNFFRDGATPGDAILEWDQRVTQLTIAAKQAVRARYGRDAERTYVTGISNGGYLTRWQLENHPELYDGGVDWEGTLFTDDGPNLFTYLPASLQNYPKWRATGDQAAHDAMIRAGFAPGSEFLWDDHYANYWDLTQRTYREEFDPGYDGGLEAGIPFCQSGTPMCDADYDWAKAPAAAHAAMRKVAVDGRIGRPMLTLHGTLDSLLPIATDSDVYTRMIDRAGRGDLSRYYVIENANHVDGRYDAFKGRVRPAWPCWAQAFLAMERWVEQGAAPPLSQFVPDTHTGDPANECTLARGLDVPGPGPGPVPAAEAGAASGSSSPGIRTTAARRHVALVARVTRRGRRTFRTTGRVVLPSGLAAAQACGSGVVAVQVKARRRTVSTRRATLAADCSFRSSVTFRHRRGRLKFTARFYGNRALLSAVAKPRFARAR